MFSLNFSGDMDGHGVCFDLVTFEALNSGNAITDYDEGDYKHWM